MKLVEKEKKYGIKIRNLRVSKNMSQEELAKFLGYAGRSMISKLENDERDFYFNTAEQLSKIFKVDISYFVDNNPTQNRINTMFITPPPKVEIEDDVKAKIDVIIAVYEQCFGVLTNEKKSILNYVIFSFYDAQKV